MNELINSIWSYEVRIFPILFGLLIFSILHALRRLTKIEYTPSYFALFPLSTIDNQLSEYLGEFYGGSYIPSSKRKKNTKLFVKSIISFFITFFLLPLLVGFVIAFFIRPNEFKVFLIMLIVWEGWHCSNAIYDFYGYRGNLKTVLKFFGVLYLLYLLFLFFVIRLSYNFAQPFVEKGEILILFTSLETIVVPIIVGITITGVLGNLFSHWLINKDALKPEHYEYVEIGEENEYEQ